MSRTTLLALAERVEAATGAGHNIDIEIFKLTDPYQYEARLCAVRNGPMGPRLGPADWDGYIQRPAYTASLDAAMSLVPSGHEWSVNWCGNSVANVNEIGVDYPVHCGGASTPALALTAACLRALAVLEQDNG